MNTFVPSHLKQLHPRFLLYIGPTRRYISVNRHTAGMMTLRRLCLLGTTISVAQIAGAANATSTEPCALVQSALATSSSTLANGMYIFLFVYEAHR